MKKIISSFFLLLFFLPITASALWWNPFTWNIFSQSNSQEIAELKKQVAELREKTLTATNTSTTTTIKRSGMFDDLIPKKQETGISDKSVNANTQPAKKIDLSKYRINKEKTYTYEELIKMGAKPVVTDKSVSKPISQPKVNTDLNMLSVENKALIKNKANQVLSDTDSIIESIQTIKEKRKTSKYVHEYLSLFSACDSTIAYFQQLKNATNIMIKISESDTTTEQQMRVVFDSWLENVKSSGETAKVLVPSLFNLAKLSDDVVFAGIQLDAIDEVARKNNISTVNSNVNISSKTTEDLEKKASDYVKSLLPKEKQITNFIIYTNKIILN